MICPFPHAKTPNYKGWSCTKALTLFLLPFLALVKKVLPKVVQKTMDLHVLLNFEITPIVFVSCEI